MNATDYTRTIICGLIGLLVGAVVLLAGAPIWGAVSAALVTYFSV